MRIRSPSRLTLDVPAATGVSSERRKSTLGGPTLKAGVVVTSTAMMAPFEPR